MIVSLVPGRTGRNPGTNGVVLVDGATALASRSWRCYFRSWPSGVELVLVECTPGWQE